MHRRCQDRIRGYLYKTIEQIKTSDIWQNNGNARLNLQNVIEFFKLQLKEDHYFGYYFDRSKFYHDELDNGSKMFDFIDENNCYDHCPCQLKLMLDESQNDKEEKLPEVVAENENEKIERDEIDAKRVSKVNDILSAKRHHVNETVICPYTVNLRCKNEQYSLCNSNGEFHCEGLWNSNNCEYGDIHRINPYRSHEELVLFSTWNLDHK